MREDDFTTTVEGAAAHARMMGERPTPINGPPAHPCPECHGTPQESAMPYVFWQPGFGEKPARCLGCTVRQRDAQK